MRRILFASLLLLAVTASAAELSYMFSRDGHSIISGNIDWKRIGPMHERWGGRYVWAKVGGREYLIRDAATLAEASAAFAEADALHREYTTLSDRMRPLEQREEQLEQQIDSITDREEGPIDKARLEQLEQQLERVGRELRKFEEEEERLDRREDALVAIAEKELERIIRRAIARGVAQRVD